MSAALTVTDAVNYWLEHREVEVRNSTMKTYRQMRLYIVGPLLIGTRLERHLFARCGRKPRDAVFLDMLGAHLISELTPAKIRTWHKTLMTHVGTHTAHVAKKLLRAALHLAAEDFQFALPVMPSRLGRGRARPKKAVLSPKQVGRLLDAARRDVERGIYYAFPFLTGVRPSEQLALLWDDVDLAQHVIHIRRSQEPNGRSTALTKTSASMRDIPLSPMLHTMLTAWRVRCPARLDGDARVFPCLGRSTHNAVATRGRPLSYTNFVNTYWRPALAHLGLPIVTPHSARHAFISTLQAHGVELGLVAKLAGHANPIITLGHYTHAIRGGDKAISQLEVAYHTMLQHDTTA